jgi:hypothetical protein
MVVYLIFSDIFGPSGQTTRKDTKFFGLSPHYRTKYGRGGGNFVRKLIFSYENTSIFHKGQKMCGRPPPPCLAKIL